jgi:Cu/Ag efflux protein CusF
MKTVFSGVVLGLMMICLVACSKKAPQSSDQPAEPLVSSSEVESTVAKVEAVDLKARKVTLSSLQGDLFIIHVGKEAVNLPQVKKGDMVDITYGRELKVWMAAPGDVVNEQSTVVVRAKPGSKPQGMGVTETNVTAKILALDKTNELAKLELANGKVVTVKVENPENLNKVKVGDTLGISYLEVVDIAVRKGSRR